MNQKYSIPVRRVELVDADDNPLQVSSDKALTVDMSSTLTDVLTADKVDLDNKDLLIDILTTLKKIEYHLSIASDTYLNDQDI